MRTKKFVFRRYANIGAADAIEDRKFLEKSFVDNGSLEVISDVNNSICIVLGRTGSGKTALLEQINRTEERAIKINPESLSLNYIASNNILRFFMEAGVNLDLFYRLLWRHVFAVELIREHYQIFNEEKNTDFWSQVRQLFSRDSKKQHAIEYLRKHGPSFWQESEFRVKEVTKSIENDLTSALDAKASPTIFGIGAEFGLNVGAVRKLTEDQKIEVVHRGQEIVDKVQMHALSKMIEILENDFLVDKQKRYFITIDRLDENWIQDEFRYGLIKALIDTVRDFNLGIQNVKIIISIREDLLDRVFRYTRGSGYQEEKYKSMYLRLAWTTAELEELLNLRVNQLIKEQYTNQTVNVVDLFPQHIQKGDPLTYFFDRTLMRPRDAILFFNDCITSAAGEAKFTQAIIQQAEATYSVNRLRAMADEWATDYPNLFELAMFLERYPTQFRFKTLETEIEGRAYKFFLTNKTEGEIYKLICSKLELNDITGLTQEVLWILFRVGVVGIKTMPHSSIVWSYLTGKLLVSDINEEALIKVHPAFWRVLGIKPT